MSDFKIESGIPIPKDRRGRSLYPFDEMKVGDSFFVAVEKNWDSWAGTKAHNRITAACHSWKKINNQPQYRIQVRQVEGGVRCWRVEDK